MDGTVSQGSFRWYLLTGNLFAAVQHADSANINQLPQLVRWLWTYAPDVSYGSIEKVKVWTAQGGLIGMSGEATAAAWKACLEKDEKDI